MSNLTSAKLGYALTLGRTARSIIQSISWYTALSTEWQLTHVSRLFLAQKLDGILLFIHLSLESLFKEIIDLGREQGFNLFKHTVLVEVILQLVFVHILQFPNGIIHTASVEFLPLQILELHLRIMAQFFTQRSHGNRWQVGAFAAWGRRRGWWSAWSTWSCVSLCE